MAPEIGATDRTPGQQSGPCQHADAITGGGQQAATVIVRAQPVQQDLIRAQARAGTDLAGNRNHSRDGRIEHFRTRNTVHTSLAGRHDPAGDQHPLERPALLLGKAIGNVRHFGQYGGGRRITSRVFNHRDLDESFVPESFHRPPPRFVAGHRTAGSGEG